MYSVVIINILILCDNRANNMMIRAAWIIIIIILFIFCNFNFNNTTTIIMMMRDDDIDERQDYFDCLPYSNCSVDNILGASGHKSDPVAFLFGFYKREGIMKVLLLRHGESANNALFKHIERTRPDASREELFEQWRIKRSEDPPLTTQGVEQARRAGKFYSSLFAEANVRIFSSPTLRALQTSKEFVRNFKVAAPVAVLGNLHERDRIYHTHRNVHKNQKRT